MKHFLSILDTPQDALLSILWRAIELRDAARARLPHDAPQRRLLAGRTLACLFGKPSLRTRVSFEQAMRRLGGTAMSLSQSEVGLGERESPEDAARVLSGMVDGIMARVSDHDTVVRLAAGSSVPVINGLSDLAHPAQALADILTLMDEFAPVSPGGSGGGPEALAGRTVAFVGDGNNVARSLAVACARLGMRFVLCSPERYAFRPEWIEKVRSRVGRFDFEAVTKPAEAVARADAVYCDTFISMGQEAETAKRLRHFAGYQVNETLLANAPSHAIVLHCLPAHRGVEITDGVMDGPRSRVFQQAHNRLDAQVGLLAELLGGR
jgi:ornithine carbamoyltransferase